MTIHEDAGRKLGNLALLVEGGVGGGSRGTAFRAFFGHAPSAAGDLTFTFRKDDEDVGSATTSVSAVSATPSALVTDHDVLGSILIHGGTNAALEGQTVLVLNAHEAVDEILLSYQGVSRQSLGRIGK